MACGADECLYGGALGGGKSQALLWGATRQVGNPHYRALILRRTFPELRELMDEAIARFPEIGGRWVASEKRVVFPSGATIEFGYCESYLDAMQYRGQQYQYIAFDEIGDLADERVWEFLLTRLRSGEDEGLVKMARCSANPGGAGHGWLKRRFIDACPPDGTYVYDEHRNSKAFIKAKLTDNKILLDKDPAYGARLKRLPDVMRQQLEDGDWSVGMGLAFPSLTRTSHLVPPPVDMGQYFGSFDWGYGHKWAFGLFGVRPDGDLRLLDSVTGRRHTPDMIVERVAETLASHDLHFSDLRYTVAGSDVKIRDEARGTYGPSILEQFLVYGWPLMVADQSRVAGYQNCLLYLQHRRLLIADTPGNVAGVAQLLEMVTDPDFPNDVLKVNADPLTGEGGDDWYDMFRYGLMSRPLYLPAPKADKTLPNRHRPWEQRSARSSSDRFTLPAVALPGSVSSPWVATTHRATGDTL